MEQVLYANGCSMTYGSGLFEDPETKLCYDHPARRAASWPGRLGEALHCQRVVNEGLPGSSNDRVVRTTIAWVMEHWLRTGRAPETLFVVIGWSGPMRREFYVDGEWRQLIPYHDYADPGLSLLNRTYRELAWSEYESAVRFGTQVLSLQAFLREHGIPYLFFDALTSFKQTDLDAEGALAPYRAHIDATRYCGIDDLCGDMASHVGIAEAGGERGHPDAQAQARWAQHLVRHIREHEPDRLPAGLPAGPIEYEGTEDVHILDLKVGLPRRPPSGGRHGTRPAPEPTPQPGRGEGLWTRLRRARRRDPFIYD